jgi:hypothetical protein
MQSMTTCRSSFPTALRARSPGAGDDMDARIGVGVKCRTDVRVLGQTRHDTHNA